VKSTTFKTLAVASTAIFAAGIFATSVSAKNVTWNLSIWGKPRAFTTGVETLAKEVEAKTGGSLKIKIHYGGSLSKPKENLDGINLGAFQMAVFCAAYHPGKNPTLNALDLPFLPFADLDIQQAVHEKFYAHPAVTKDMARWNAKIIMTSLLPQYEFMGVGEPPKTLADWKGKRVRALGGIGKAMKKVGAVPTTVPAPETYQLLERGAVDAVSWPFTYAHAAYKVNEISKWFTGNMAPGTVTCPLVYNTKAFGKLTAVQQNALVDARIPAYAALKAAYKAADDKNLPAFRKSMMEIKYDDATLDAFRQAGAKPVWDDWIKEATAAGVPAQELLDLILAEAKKASM
jgi:TRAP-type C4-dicarboxylate transport system substrate-binding protein